MREKKTESEHFSFDFIRLECVCRLDIPRLLHVSRFHDFMRHSIIIIIVIVASIIIIVVIVTTIIIIHIPAWFCEHFGKDRMCVTPGDGKG